MYGLGHRWLRGSWIMALAGSIVLLAPTAAQAASSSSLGRLLPSRIINKTVFYSTSWVFRSHAIGRCVTLGAQGKITYTIVTHPNPRDPPPTDSYENIKLTNPVLTAKVARYTRTNTCTVAVNLSKISIGQFWTGYACSYNPSLSVSFPWGVSFGAWPSCGDRRQASYVTHYGRGARYKQSNSGSPTRFGNDTRSFQEPAPCYGVTASVVAYVGNSSDSFGASNGSSSRRVCLQKP
jgi:hypothetical protein